MNRCTLPRQRRRAWRVNRPRLALVLIAVAVASVGWPVTAGAQSVPGAVSELAASPRSTEVVLTWVAPSSGDAPTGYEYQQKAGLGSYGSWTDIPGSDGDTTSFVVTGLDAGVTYGFKIRGTNTTGDGTESAEVTATVGGSTVYDTDSDGLIEINSLAQLNAMRWDLDADGVPEAKADSYGAAFPDAVARLGCVPSCSGYELTADLDMDTNGDGKTHEPKFAEGDDCKFENNAWSGDDCDYDTYWNSGQGWEPIGTGAGAEAYWGIFEGNDNTVDRLFNSRGTEFAGLFGFVEAGSELRNVNVTNARIWSTVNRPVGVLAGHSHGSIVRSFTSGQIIRSGDIIGTWPDTTRASATGGLVGYIEGTVSRSGSSVDISGQGLFGGLVGYVRSNNGRTGKIEYSYATGDLSYRHKGTYGGLVGVVFASTVEYSYATGDIVLSSLQTTTGCVGGLMGRLHNGLSGHSVKASYSTGEIRGENISRWITSCGFGGLVGRVSGDVAPTIEDSYNMTSIYDVDFTPTCSGVHFCIVSVGIGKREPDTGLNFKNYYAAGKSSVNRHHGLMGEHLDLLSFSQPFTVHFSYWDTDSTPESIRELDEYGTGLSRSALQAPTAPPGLDSSGRACDHADYEGDTTYCGWSTSLWDFGDSTQYPRLKVDFNGDGVATVEEFGPQAKDIAPRISGMRTFTLAQGTAISDTSLPVAYQGNGALTYRMSSLPAGITLGADRALSGTPTVAGTSEHTMTVTDADQNTAASDAATATLTFTVTPVTPTAPTLTAAPAPGGVRLSWTGGGDYKTGWEYALSETQGTTGEWTPIPSSTGTTTSHTVTQLTTGNTYYFKVRAVNGAERETKGPESNEDSAVAQAPAPPPAAPPPTGPVFVAPISQPTPIEELCPADEVPDAGFTDIAGWPEEFIVAINCMAWYGLTNGTTPTTFSPDRQLTRAQQVLFLQRIRNIATSTETTDTGSFAGNVNAALTALHDLGIIADAEYAAGADGQVGVDRGVFAEGLHKSLRTLSVVFGSTPNPYTDTGDRGIAERQAVTQLADREVMRGVAEGQFAPERPITRAQAVLVMSRVFTLAEITATPTRPTP